MSALHIKNYRNTTPFMKWCLMTVFSILFAGIYEFFSFGVISWHMVLLPLYPLLLGCLPAWIVASRHIPSVPALWNDAVIILMVGSAITGALEIYGTASTYTFIYPLVGWLLLIFSLSVYISSNLNRLMSTFR